MLGLIDEYDEVGFLVGLTGEDDIESLLGLTDGGDDGLSLELINGDAEVGLVLGLTDWENGIGSLLGLNDENDEVGSLVGVTDGTIFGLLLGNSDVDDEGDTEGKHVTGPCVSEIDGLIVVNNGEVDEGGQNEQTEAPGMQAFGQSSPPGAGQNWQPLQDVADEVHVVPEFV